MGEDLTQAHKVSDGIVAPGYEPAALDILAKKKGGKYCVLQIDPIYTPPAIETKQVYGISLQQRRNDALITPDAYFNERVTKNTEVPKDALVDLTVASVALKVRRGIRLRCDKAGL